MLKVDINLLFVAINLLVLYLLMKHFLFKPVHKILEERQAQIDKSLADAAAATEAAHQLEQERKAAMSGIDEEKTTVLAAARKEAVKEYDRIVANAKGQAEEILQRADETAQQHRAEVLEKTQSEIKDMVVQATVKIIGARGAENDGALYEQFLQKVGEADDTGSK